MCRIKVALNDLCHLNVNQFLSLVNFLFFIVPSAHHSTKPEGQRKGKKEFNSCKTMGKVMTSTISYYHNGHHTISGGIPFSPLSDTCWRPP
jgi:hypothetical protein